MVRRHGDFVIIEPDMAILKDVALIKDYGPASVLPVYGENARSK